jgi:tetratricopeptide (TPR) repeat protein
MGVVSRARASSSPTSLAGRALFALANAGAAHAVGSVHTVVLCVVATAVGVAAALIWWDAEPMTVRASAALLVGVGLVLTGFTALQCVPLPSAVLTALAPHNAAVWSRALAPLGEAGPRWAPFSLDPLATRVEVLRGVTYLAALVTTLRIARRREGSAFVGAVVVVTGVALALAALLHPAFGAHRLFGVYEPATPIADRHLAPLLNPNNLAGYLNAALCLALAEMLAPEPRLPRPIGLVLVLFLGATQLWVASRGGVIATGVGIFVVLVISRLDRGDARGAVAKLSLLAGLACAIGVTLVVLAGSEDASMELLDADASKVRLVGISMRMLPSVPFFGCGRGAFESAFPAFRGGYSGHFTLAYPENVVAQWLIEWGTPVGALGLGGVLVALRPSVALARSTSSAGAWAALVALALQQLCDLGSEVPGLVLAGTACAGIVVAGTPGHRSRWRLRHWARSPRAVSWAALGTTTVAVAVAATGLRRELHDDQRALHDAALERKVSPDALRALARGAMSLHPAEPYLPYIVGLRASIMGDDNPLPWLAATLERAPVYAPAHLALARLFANRSPAQARFEYRTAMQQMPDLYGVVLPEAPRLVNTYDDALELVPDGVAGEPVLETLALALLPRLPATSLRLDKELLRRAPEKYGPVERAAAAAVEDLDQPWCRGSAAPACIQRALDATARAVQREPRKCAPRVLRARAVVAGGDRAGGLSDLQAATDVVADRIECLEALEVFASSVGDARRADQALDLVANAGCADDGECMRQLSWVANVEERSGFPRKALAAFEKAHDRVPDDGAALENIGRLAAQLGLHGEAAEAYERLEKLHPDERKWQGFADAERSAALRGAIAR